jgi:tRNA-specific 2-thiouridylase
MQKQKIDSYTHKNNPTSLKLRGARKIVAVGMSGGVDSTMAALLLKQQGFKVIGLTMKLWDNSFKFKKPIVDACFSPNEAKDIKELKLICKKIGIKHYTVDVSKDYKQNVLKYFTNEYLAGFTPNPCIFCNQKIKFGALLDLARKSGIKFDYFATGHYVQISFNKKTGLFVLKKGKDKLKDQSYFLYRLSQDQLKKLIFPLSNYKKEEIKKLARVSGFANLAKKPESQDFIGCGDHQVLFKKSEIKTGDIVDIKGKLVGKHNGIINYTIGQRKGVSGGGSKTPVYVIKIDAKKNQIIVGPKELLLKKELIAMAPNWISISKPKIKISALAKIRYGAKEIACAITPLKNNQLNITFVKPQLAITPGQSIVFYRGETLLGGAIILKAY